MVSVRAHTGARGVRLEVEVCGASIGGLFYPYCSNCRRQAGRAAGAVTVPSTGSDVVSLYKDMKVRGLVLGHHESDLHVVDSPRSRAVLKLYPILERQATPFRCEVTGAASLDIPFAYEPFWKGSTRGRSESR